MCTLWSSSRTRLSSGQTLARFPNPHAHMDVTQCGSGVYIKSRAFSDHLYITQPIPEHHQLTVTWQVRLPPAVLFSFSGVHGSALSLFIDSCFFSTQKNLLIITMKTVLVLSILLCAASAGHIQHTQTHTHIHYHPCAHAQQASNVVWYPLYSCMEQCMCPQKRTEE